MKLQDAFISETGTTWGSWQYIGYKMETTNNVFKYEEENAPASGTEALGTAKAVWKATPLAGLNDCKTTDSWGLKIAKIQDGNGAAYTARVSSADCNVLTPSFGKLDATGAATIAAN